MLRPPSSFCFPRTFSSSFSFGSTSSFVDSSMAWGCRPGRSGVEDWKRRGVILMMDARRWRRICAVKETRRRG
ncbi:hypothetical protein BRADI_3g55495v3 [Brachypodium distachyon]|uniref:Uncharacterized protein n=1 Tax=Brachypodium distachyon TaxID=15368 RepID=A0A2K2D580_BRADI|nr:hypothetical protein BRADI_3g55495v3 [Brachypodium distachyon]